MRCGLRMQELVTRTAVNTRQVESLSCGVRYFQTTASVLLVATWASTWVCRIPVCVEITACTQQHHLRTELLALLQRDFDSSNGSLEKSCSQHVRSFVSKLVPRKEFREHFHTRYVYAAEYISVVGGV
jgi:hypothetical protein